MNKSKIITASVLILVASFLSISNVYADAWIGGGTVGGGFGGAGGGTSSGGCSDSTNAKYYLHCTGYSWMYFEYQGGWEGDFTLPMTVDASSVTISGTCADVGGFYHLGRNAQGFSYGGFAEYTNLKGKGHEKRAPYTYMGQSGSWGHMQTYTWGQISAKTDVSYKTKSSVYQDIYRNNTVIYKAKETSSVDTAFNAFKEAYQYVNGSAYTGSTFPDNLYAFCYNPDTMSGSTFVGRTTGSVTTTPSMSNGAYSVSFSHQIKRTAGADTSTTYTVAHKTGNGTYSNVSGFTNKTMSGITENYNNTAKATTTISGTLGYGQSLVVCAKNTYINDTAAGTTGTSSDCETISRPNPVSNFGARTRMSGDNGDTPGGDYSITFRHDLRRESGDEWNGGNDWATHVSGGGTSKSGTWTGTSTSWTNVASDTVSGHVNPGMSSGDICQYISYHVQVTGENGGGASGNSTKQCANITRKKGSFTGKLRVYVNGTEKSNGDTIELGKNATATVKFQGKITREYDGSGGSLADDYRSIVSGGGTAKGPASTSAISEGATTTAYTDQFTATVLPDENVVICQTFYWDTIYYNTGSHTEDSEKICITLHRDREECDIDTTNLFGVYDGRNVGQLSVFRNSDVKTMSKFKSSDASKQEQTLYAKPGDTLGFEHSVCAGGQMSRDYYGVNQSTNYEANAYYNNANAALSSNPNFLFGANKNWSFKFGYSGINANVSNYISTRKSPNTLRSDTNNGYRCNDSVADYRYQVTGGFLINACNSSKLTNEASNVGKVISQTLSFKWEQVSAGTTTASSDSTLKANVAVPYNYDTHIRSQNVVSKPVSAGTNVDVAFRFDVLPRVNSLVQTEAYATHTKPSTVKFFYWTVDREVSEDTIRNSLLAGGVETDNGYFTSSDPSAGKTLLSEETKTYAAGEGKIFNISIPIGKNLKIGTKVCYAASIYPSDSHNNPTYADVGDLDQSTALETSGSGYYSSKAHCFTVGKKPTIIAKGGGIYAQNGIYTTTTMRKIGSTDYLFGSWSEYSALSPREIIGISSGAGLHSGSTLLSGTRVCRFSSMTLANEECQSSGALGNLSSGPLTSSSSPLNIVDQMITRYTSGHIVDLADEGITNVELWGKCSYDAATGTYKATSSSPSDGKNYTCLSNGAAYVYSSETLTLNPDSLGSIGTWYTPWAIDDYSSRTFIIHAKNIRINENVTYGSYAYEGSGAYHKYTVFDSTSSIPQFIFIADNEISIGETVTNLDSWLIAPIVNTCGQDKYDVKFTNGANDANRITAMNCNRQLSINGPVYTRTLKLNRTHGGGGESILPYSTTGFSAYWQTSNEDRKTASSPAEIFNISPEVYFWTYHEATRFSQATTTYQRELPVRY